MQNEILKLISRFRMWTIILNKGWEEAGGVEGRPTGICYI